MDSSSVTGAKSEINQERKLTLDERIYPTPMDDQVKPASLDKRIYPTPVGARVLPCVPDISDDQTVGDNLLGTRTEPMSALSGSVSRLKHMFENLSSPSPATTISSASLDKTDDLPSLKVKDIAVKFSGADGESRPGSSGAVSCVMEKEFATQFDNRTKDEDHALEVLNAVLQEQEVRPGASGYSKELVIENSQNELENELTGALVQSRDTVGENTQNSPSEEESKQPEDGADIGDELRYDSEFLFENDFITQESLRKSSEPELIRRGTLTSQFLFGWNEGETDKNGRKEKAERAAEENSETAEITMNNDVAEASENRIENVDETSSTKEGIGTEDLLHTSCSTQASLPQTPCNTDEQPLPSCEIVPRETNQINQGDDIHFS